MYCTVIVTHGVEYMSRSKSSGRWLNEHVNDHYVKESKKDGYRSRASYKLIELNKKDKLFRPGMRVVDLGAAPGGWCQVVSPLVGETGTVLASDILPMDSIEGVDFVLGDFTEEAIFEQLLNVLDGKLADVVISDMAPNMSGMAAIDQPRAMELIDLAVEFAELTLKSGGSLLMKVFQGQGFDELLKVLRRDYSAVVTRKPEASRARSKEVYLLAKGYKG